MKWMIEEAKLGEDQREIINEVSKLDNKPIWIQGHAGSGKSIVLLHSMSDYLIRSKNAKVAVVVFTRSLVDLMQIGISQIPALNNKNIPVLTTYGVNERINQGEKFDAIFCDEVQDLPLKIILAMKNSSQHLIIAGDVSQSIFEKDPRFGLPTASPSEIKEQIDPVEKRSHIIYRLTNSVINVLKKVFTDLINEKQHLGKVDSVIRLFKSEKSDHGLEEIQFTWDEMEMTNRTRQDEVAAILIYKKEHIVYYCQKVLEYKKKPRWPGKKRDKYTKNDFISLNSHLENHNIPIIFIGNGAGSLEEADKTNKVVIMTYHSAKGLDFDAVCLPLIRVDMNNTTNENALILVALSRAKRDLLISYTDHMYDTFKRFLIDIEPKVIGEEDDEEVIF